MDDADADRDKDTNTNTDTDTDTDTNTNTGTGTGTDDTDTDTDAVGASEATIERLLAAMSLQQKTALTSGASLCYLAPVPELGIPALKVSDGPSGVRGDSLMGRRSLSLPCGMAIGSTWNPELVNRLGHALAAEARSKGVHVLLGPTVCIPRTPLAGRTFESFSEDPLLAARLAVAYVTGVQSHGVACCIKHFACNDQEHERMTISAEVSERALREIHLVPFQQAVQEAGVWSVMTAYNKVNGVYCCEQPHLLTQILRNEWGFDGLVMSDWFGTHSTTPAALAGLDLEMPGPPAWFGPTLAAAVRDRLVGESVVDGKVRNVLRLMGRVGILPDDAPAGPATPATPIASGAEEAEEDDPGRRALARVVAAEGTVLLVNDGMLPLDPARVSSVAVIGPNASQMAMGGGSSEVTPYRRRSVADALADRLPDATVSYEVGCRIDRGLPPIDMRLVGGGAGFMVEYFDSPDPPSGGADDLSDSDAPGTGGGPVGGPVGAPVEAALAHSARIMWLGSPRPGLEPGTYSVRIRGTFTPDVSGAWQLGLDSAGRSVMRLDGSVVIDNSEPRRGVGMYGAGSEPVEVTLDLVAGRAYELAIEVWPRSSPQLILGARIGASPPDTGDEFERAVGAAADADVAVVVVGSNGQWESEGHDRPDLSLPGRQRELVEAVLDTNARTIVVVNAGSPVEMPWADRAAAILMPWYAGEEGADALADIVVGASEPTGRLPITFPARVEDGPAGLGVEGDRYPGVEGKVVYGEEVLVGYRFFETARLAPLFAFGHGLSYGDLVYDEVEIAADLVTVVLTNKGARRGSEVVQVYVRALKSPVRRPERELAGFVKVAVEAGQQARVEVELSAAAFRYWDVDAHQWRPDPGRYEVMVGSSSRAVKASAVVRWDDMRAE
jgi:beta-glucosidase